MSFNRSQKETVPRTAVGGDPFVLTAVPLPPCSGQPLSAAPVPGIALRHAFLPFSAWSGNFSAWLCLKLPWREETWGHSRALGPVLKEDGNRESSHKGSGDAETRPREDKHLPEPCSCNKYRRKNTWREGPSYKRHFFHWVFQIVPRCASAALGPF